MNEYGAGRYRIKIIFEDNQLLVVEKPPNMPVQADASGDVDLQSALKEYIKQKYAKPGKAFLALCHRLDRPVGGVMAALPHLKMRRAPYAAVCRTQREKDLSLRGAGPAAGRA